ncbi:MAG: hypothetical protein WB868_21555 [Xanthobacteraceae bacterium]
MTPEEAVKEFKRCRHWLEAALAEDGLSTITIDDVREKIQRGAMHFWPGKNCACVTEIYEFPRAKFLNVTLAGGDMAEILGMVPSFLSFGAHCGCSKLTEAGRAGWERVLKARGWKKELVVLSIQIDNPSNGVEGKTASGVARGSDALELEKGGSLGG